MKSKLRFLFSAVVLGTAAASSAQLPDAWDVATLDANGVKVADWMLEHPRRANHKDWT